MLTTIYNREEIRLSAFCDQLSEREASAGSSCSTAENWASGTGGTLTAGPAITAPALSRPPRPGKPAGQRADAGKCTLDSAANVKPKYAQDEAYAGRIRASERQRAPLPGPNSRPLRVRGPRNTGAYNATR